MTSTAPSTHADEWLKPRARNYADRHGARGRLSHASHCGIVGNVVTALKLIITLVKGEGFVTVGVDCGII